MLLLKIAQSHCRSRRDCSHRQIIVTVKVQFNLLVEYQTFCSRCRLTSPIDRSLISLIKGERKIKENGLTHCLDEGYPIVEIILRESWPRGSPKALQRQVSMSHGSHGKKFFGICFSHAGVVRQKTLVLVTLKRHVFAC